MRECTAFARVFMIVAAAGLVPEPAAAATSAQRFQFSGGRVQTILDTVDATGCILYSFYFDAIVGTIKETRRPETSSLLATNVFAFNQCTREGLPPMFGLVESLPASAIQVDRQLDWAKVAATITVADFNGNETSIAIDLAFSGYGPLIYRALDRSMFKAEYFFSRSYGKLENREAWPAGTVTVNGQALPLQPGFCRGGGGCSSLHWTHEGRLSLDFSPHAEAWGITAATSLPSITTTAAVSSPSTVAARSLLAFVQRFDPPCVSTFVDVWATTMVSTSTGPPVDSVEIGVGVSQFDVCTFEEVLFAGSPFRAPVPPGTVFDVAQSLTHARIQSAVPVVDLYTGEPVGVVEADLTLFASDAAPQRSIEMHIFTGPSGSLATQMRVARPATASGTVMVGPLTLVATPETTGSWLTGGRQVSVGR